MISARNLVHRGTRMLGLHVQRRPDPYRTACRLLRDRPVDHVVDGGAYHGKVSQRLAQLFPLALVHAFEPQPESFAILSRRFGPDSRVQTHPCALSDRVGEAAIHVNARPCLTSLLPGTEPATADEVRTQNIATTTLDAWAAGQRIESVSFLKLDLQGHELAALRGAQGLLAGGVDVVLAEVNFRRRYAGSCLFHELAAFLAERHFQLFRLYEPILDAHGGWRQADALFVHSRLLGG
jgi:FkbM family methyltransferase